MEEETLSIQLEQISHILPECKKLHTLTIEEYISEIDTKALFVERII